MLRHTTTKRSIIRSPLRSIQRTYTTPKKPFVFQPYLPNDNSKYIFPQEKLTPEENQAAIPPRPTFDDISKKVFDIPNPEDVADLVTRLNKTDILISRFSKSRRLFNNSHTVVIKNKEGDDKVVIREVVFPYLNVANSWTRLFNAQIKPLKDVEATKAGFGVSITKTLKAKLDSVYEKSNDIGEFFREVNALENSRLVLKGKVNPVELAGLITIDNATIYLLNRGDILDDFIELMQLITFIQSNVSMFTNKGLSDVLEKLARVVYNDSTRESDLHVLNDFLKGLIETQRDVSIAKLHPVTLDKLAYILIKEGDLASGFELLKIMIDEMSECPSEKTLAVIFNEYNQQHSGKSIEEMIRELCFLKPAIFHKGVDVNSFPVLLKIVRDLRDFQKLIDLVGDNKVVLDTFQLDIFKRFKQFQDQFSVDEYDSRQTRRLYLTQLIRVFQRKRINLNEETIKHLKNEFTLLKDPVNLTVLNNL